MKLVMKGQITEGPIFAVPDSARLGSDVVTIAAQLEAGVGDILIVWEVGGVDFPMAMHRARNGVPEQVIAMFPWEDGSCPLELANWYRDVEFPALAGAKEG